MLLYSKLPRRFEFCDAQTGEIVRFDLPISIGDWLAESVRRIARTLEEASETMRLAAILMMTHAGDMRPFKVDPRGLERCKWGAFSIHYGKQARRNLEAVNFTERMVLADALKMGDGRFPNAPRWRPGATGKAGIIAYRAGTWFRFGTRFLNRLHAVVRRSHFKRHPDLCNGVADFSHIYGLDYSSTEKNIIPRGTQPIHDSVSVYGISNFPKVAGVVAFANSTEAKIAWRRAREEGPPEPIESLTERHRQQGGNRPDECRPRAPVWVWLPRVKLEPVGPIPPQAIAQEPLPKPLHDTRFETKIAEAVQTVAAAVQPQAEPEKGIIAKIVDLFRAGTPERALEGHYPKRDIDAARRERLEELGLRQPRHWPLQNELPETPFPNFTPDPHRSKDED